MKALVLAALLMAAPFLAKPAAAQANTQANVTTVAPATAMPTAPAPTRHPPHAPNRIDRIRPDAPSLAGYGSYAIGVREMAFVNPAQPDVANATADAVPTADRAMTVEVWYPAADDTPPGGSYATFLRDGLTEVTLTGSAARDAMPFPGEVFPLVILSHGYPGNRFLLSHLGENLASKGYVVAAIDHPDSTYSDLGAFGSTLLNRATDQRFVLDSMAGLTDDLGAITDADRTAIIGYSMGGYGALIFGGAGVTKEAAGFSFAPPQMLLSRHVSGTEGHAALIDDRVRAVVAFGPWGRNTDLWDADGMAGLEKPLLLIAGSLDDVSVYPAIRQIFTEAKGTARHLLTFENANHNAGAPMPAPEESWRAVETLDFMPFEHYADAVWDTVRMNNISQHFVTAFLAVHLRDDTDKARFLDLVPVAADGVIALDEDGTPTEAHTHWPGFAPRTAVGLRFETLQAGE